MRRDVAFVQQELRRLVGHVLKLTPFMVVCLTEVSGTTPRGTPK
jgi:hypothetical protein